MDEKYKLLGNFEKILKFVDKNSQEKLNLYLFLEKLLLKIEHSEITSIFYNNFFNFGGGGNVPCVPPGGATAYGTMNGALTPRGQSCLVFKYYARNFSAKLNSALAQDKPVSETPSRCT